MENIPKDFSNALFQASLISFTNQILEIQMTVNKIQMDMIRRFEGKSKKIQIHSDIIKNCRKGIEKCEQILKDSKSYFIDIKLFSVYQMFQSIFRLITYFTKIISEAYLYRFRMQVAQQPIQQKQIFCTCSCTQMGKKQKQLQKIDYELSIMEKQEILIVHEMQKLSKDLCLDMQKIDKISSQKKNLVFLDLQSSFNQVSLKTENILNAFLKNTQIENQLYEQLRPGMQLYEEVKNEMKKQISVMFPICLKKIISLLIKNFREKFHGRIKRFMSCSYEKTKNKSQLDQQKDLNASKIRKSLADSNEGLQTINTDLVNEIKKLKNQLQLKDKQIQKYKSSLKSCQNQISLWQNQYYNLEQIFKERTMELQQSKTSLSWLTRVNSILKQKQKQNTQTTTITNRKIKTEQKVVKTSDKYTETIDEQIGDESEDLSTLVKKSKILQWNQKKNQKKPKLSTQIQKQNSNPKVTIELLVQKMNQALKLNNKEVFEKNLDSENIDQIIIKWKEGINHKTQKIIEKSESKPTKRKSHSKNKKLGGNKIGTSKISTSKSKLQKIQKKTVQTQTQLPKNRFMIQSARNLKGKLRQKNHEKTLSQRNLLSPSDTREKQNIYSNRATLINHEQEKTDFTENQNHGRRIIQTLRFSSNLQSIEEDEVKEKKNLCFEQLDFKKFPEKGKPGKSVAYQWYLKEKHKRQAQNQNKVLSKQKWQGMFDKKKREQTQKYQQSVLMKLQNLDFAIWTVKIQQFIQGTKQTDPKKYEKFIYNMLNHLKEKTNHEIIQKAYQKYQLELFTKN